MKAIVTGGHGTIGAYLVELLQSKGYEVVVWDRAQVKTDNYEAMFNFIKETKPDVFFHLAAVTSFECSDLSWHVNVQWPSELAWITKELSIPFIHTSTSLVYSQFNEGPYTINTLPSVENGYGYEKLRAEEKIMRQNPQARIVRLGWQIAQKGENSMITSLDHKTIVNASASWYPSCSFVEDTCLVLLGIQNKPPGIYMADSNTKWSFLEIVEALKMKYNKNWNIVPMKKDVEKKDQRMIDERISISSLKEHLKQLP